MASESQKEYHKKYYIENKEKWTGESGYNKKETVKYTTDEEYKTKRDLWRRKSKMKFLRLALQVYGNRCQECGHTDIRVLEWHHTANDPDKNSTAGRQYADISTVAQSGRKIKGFQLLCANCHILADHRDGTSVRGKMLKEIYNERNRLNRILEDY